MTQSTETERAEFEEWAKAMPTMYNRDMRRIGDGYERRSLQEAWNAWQEARRAQVVQSENFNAAWLSHIAVMDEKHNTSNNNNFFAAGFAYGQLSAPVVPQGWKLVPERPTQEMCDAAKYNVHAGLSVFKWADGYYAMLAAAPQPPEADSNYTEFEGIKPEAAPVQMPKPMAYYDGERWYANEEAAICACAEMPKLQKLYTEKQVRQLLAEKEIK